MQQVLADSTGSVSKDASDVAENQTEASNSVPAEKSVSEADDVGSTNRVSSVTTQTDLTECSEQKAAEEAGDDEGDLRGGDGGTGSSWRLEKNKELLNTRLGPYTRSMSPRKKSRAEKMTDSTGPKPTRWVKGMRGGGGSFWGTLAGVGWLHCILFHVLLDIVSSKTRIIWRL